MSKLESRAADYQRLISEIGEDLSAAYDLLTTRRAEIELLSERIRRLEEEKDALTSLAASTAEPTMDSAGGGASSEGAGDGDGAAHTGPARLPQDGLAPEDDTFPVREMAGTGKHSLIEGSVPFAVSVRHLARVLIKEAGRPVKRAEVTSALIAAGIKLPARNLEKKVSKILTQDPGLLNGGGGYRLAL